MMMIDDEMIEKMVKAHFLAEGNDEQDYKHLVNIHWRYKAMKAALEASGLVEEVAFFRENSKEK